MPTLSPGAYGGGGNNTGLCDGCAAAFAGFGGNKNCLSARPGPQTPNHISDRLGGGGPIEEAVGFFQLMGESYL